MKIILTCCVAALGVAGCATYEPRPLSPSATVTAYEARTLDNPGLRAFVQRNIDHDLGTWPPSRWDLELLTLAAFFYHPDLDVARAKWGVARAGELTAGMRPNPTINANIQRNADTPSGTSPWTLGLNLDIPIETAGKRGYRIEQARHLSEAAHVAIVSTAWQVRSRVRSALLDLHVAQRNHEILLRQQQLQQTNVTLLEHRLAVGMASTPEVTLARIALTQSTLALNDAERLQLDARTRLAGALGLSSEALNKVAIAADPLTLASALPTNEAREQALLNRGDVLGALAEYAASQSALQLEIAKQVPDAHLGPGYTWDQGARKWSVGLSLVLPVLNRNEGPVAEARARRVQAAANFDATQARAINEIEVALSAYRASREKLIAVEALVAEQNNQLRKAETSFKAGETDRVALVGAQLELTQIALSRADAQAKTQQAWGALEDAMQRPLAAPSLPATAIQDNPRPTKEKQ